MKVIAHSQSIGQNESENLRIANTAYAATEKARAQRSALAQSQNRSPTSKRPRHQTCGSIKTRASASAAAAFKATFFTPEHIPAGRGGGSPRVHANKERGEKKKIERAALEFTSLAGEGQRKQSDAHQLSAYPYCRARAKLLRPTGRERAGI